MTRGRERSTKAKWLEEGWELASEIRGTLRTELKFRRVKPKSFGNHLLTIVGAVGLTKPRTRLIAGTSGALILVASIAGVAFATRSEGELSTPAAKQTTVPAVPSPEPTAVPAETASPTESTITDVTVDDLVQKYDAGETSIGDQFSVTGELVRSDLWGTGASGDFIVMLKTREGSELQVFVDESDANGWTDGTQVTMVLQLVEVTINGETSDGFQARSTKLVAS